MKYMGLLLSPIPRNMELIMLYAVIKGMPIKQTVRYATVPSTASAGVDITETMGCTSKSSSTVRATDTETKRTTVFPTACAVFLLSPAPIFCAMLTVVPMASPTIITVSMCMTWEPTETAVVLATPSNCPMMNKSAIP